MKIAVFDTHAFETRTLCEAAEASGLSLTLIEAKLSAKTAALAGGHAAVCAFVNDRMDAPCLEALKEIGVQMIALRSAGFNHVDLQKAQELGLVVVRVPEYSPHAVAEHAVALILTLVRKTHKAYNRVREANFSLNGLVGFDLYQKTVGVIGAGKIGRAFAEILRGFGCRVLVYDPNPDRDWALRNKVECCDLAKIYKESNIISLHAPLQPATFHLIGREAFSLMKDQVILINTGRGGLIDTKALIEGLKSGKVGGAGLDVYEEEENVFFEDTSEQVLKDDVLARLLTFPNVILTSHQGFLTKEALTNIAETTMKSIADFRDGLPLKNEVSFQSAKEKS